MTARNDITGDKLISKPITDKYAENYDAIFRKGTPTLKKYNIPIDFVVRASTPEEAQLRISEFLLRAVTEFRVDYNIVDYEAPYGYPVEEINE